MRKTLLAAAFVAASIAATPALAQDDQRFNGPWVGVTTGYDTFTNGENEEDSSEDGIVYGIALGYDFNLNGFVLGAEAELTDSSVSSSALDVLEEGDELALSSGRDIYVGIRVGLPVSETIMIYAKGGYTSQRFNASYILDGDSESVNENIDGFRVGGGLELDLGQPFARIEYRYSDYGSLSDTDVETSRHQAVVTAGLRF